MLLGDLPLATVFVLTNEVRPYAWGSPTAVAEFLGRPAIEGRPEAEIWIGAYPASPSRLADGRSLVELIAEDPESALGTDVVDRYGPRLPFLVKVLGIGSPVSIQAHPSAEQARDGFAAEQARGLSTDDPARNYKDTNHKPELLCALTEVEAFCGLRSAEEASRLVRQLAVPALAGLVEALQVGGVAAATRWALRIPAEEIAGTVAALADSARQVRGGPDGDALAWLTRLAGQYPEDRGVVLVLLCEFLRLAPGDAVYVPAGCLHSYLSGLGVEVMAESDNVLRAGLTPKHVAAEELLAIIDYESGAQVIRADPRAGRTDYDTGVAEFALSRVVVAGETSIGSAQPQVLLVASGAVRSVSADGSEQDLGRGETAFVPASAGEVLLHGSGTVFLARPGRADAAGPVGAQLA